MALKTVAKNNNFPLFANLVLDEMAIKKHVSYNGKSHDGYVDMGFGIPNDSEDIATQSLVFMLSCVNMRWKVPIGYFMINGLSADLKAGLVRIALDLCEEADVKVIGLTFDGAASNITMAKVLGYNFDDPLNLTTVFEYGSHTIHVLPNACHNVKLIRNAFEYFGKFINEDGSEVKFAYLRDLVDLQEAKEMHIANKIGKSHIKFHNQIMKVYLATQIFSRSVALALTACKDNLRLPNFENCQPTIFFIKLMNDLFDVFN